LRFLRKIRTEKSSSLFLGLLFFLDFSSLNLCFVGIGGGIYKSQMKSSCKEPKCLQCNEEFHADFRNWERQKYCGKEVCRKASKRASQHLWLQKPKNLKYFRDKDNVKRVQDWRKEHPGYWKRCKKKAALPLQDACPAQLVEQEPVTKEVSLPQKEPLQDVSKEAWIMKHPLVVGLISHLMACTLQGDIAQIIRLLVGKGRDILDQPSRTLTKGNLIYDDQKTTADPRAGSPDSAPFQLDRPQAHSP
jgi:hypothetical protein